MLEIRDICKTYRAKAGVEVKALDHVSLTFPDHGMIFLLGKSGSGKSTLLNVVGGLDTYDGGELIIRGRSSKSFKRSDFDSYRNTFIGFIFQEYNILDEFSVGANIALALELQGQRATEDRINEILAEVDLAGYGNRKPNELSGGQKQRVAIARALIKQPQIIMADEPTGALDSTTGDQVLKTLKKLSREKLVIVVSHDRDFAEQFGDRIIELSDGRVISDTTIIDDAAGEFCASGMQIVSDTQINIAENYTLTTDDLAAINAYLAKHKHDITISRGATGGGSAGRTHMPTVEVETKTYTKEDAKFIRSRLPLRKAAKMGLSSIKSKPVRLIFTILLSLIAFSLFGFADTAIAYDKMTTGASSLRDTSATTLALSVRLREVGTSYDENGEVDYQNIYYGQSDTFNDKDIAALEAQTGLRFFPVYNGSSAGNNGFNLYNYLVDPDALANTMNGSIFTQNATGVTEMTEADMKSLGFTLSEGRYPKNIGEIAITEYIYRMFSIAGFTTHMSGANKHEDILGSTIRVNCGTSEAQFKVVGVVDTGFDFDAPEYAPLHWNAEGNNDYTQKDIYKLQERLKGVVENSFHTIFFAPIGTIDTLPEIQHQDRYITWGAQFWNGSLNVGTQRKDDKDEYYNGEYMQWMVNEDKLDSFDILWFDGSESKDSLTRNDYIIPISVFAQYGAAASERIWEMSPLTELREHFIGLGQDEKSNFRTLSDHWQMTGDYEDDGMGGTMWVERYFYAKALGWTDAVYEQKLTAALNAAYRAVYPDYNWNLTAQQYKELATGQYDGWTFNTLQELSLDNRLRFVLMMQILSNYDDAFCQTFLADPDVVQYMRNYSGVENVEKYLRDQGYTEQQKSFYISGYAASYMLNKYNENGKGQGRSEFFGFNVKDTETEICQEMIKNATEEQRTFTFRITEYNSGSNSHRDVTKVITGVYIPKTGMGQQNCVISPDLYKQARDSAIANGAGNRYETSMGFHESGRYSLLLCEKPADMEKLKLLVGNHYNTEDDFIFKIESPVMETLDTVDEMISILDKVFLGVGVGFALFASLMMFNFISVSITNKKREIGILRAVGARSSDVFSIFFTEAFFIAFINFLLAAAVSFVGVTAINSVLRNEMGVDLTILTFGVRQVVLLFAVSILVAFISSFLPVRKIANKTPIDAMKDR